jgi:hypothetical protein
MTPPEASFGVEKAHVFAELVTFCLQRLAGAVGGTPQAILVEGE